MRGVRDESPLRGHGLIDPTKQSIDGYCKRSYLDRKMTHLYRMQLLILALVYFLG